MSEASAEVKTNMEFPKIIRFLVVDRDTAYRKFIQDALQSLGCKVKVCKYKEQALSLLLDQKHGFDIVLVDVNKHDEMGFKFVEIVSSKMNIPIIIMCSTSDNEIITLRLNFGACQVAVKPVGINDVQQFWQCALEHRRQHLLGVDNSASNSERLHGQENRSNQGTTEGRPSKTRLVWTGEFEAQFVEAVHACGGKDAAVPKKIMERMNVPNLTRENIASHLQKYRLNSDPNYVGGKGKRKAAQAMLVNTMEEQSPVVAHPNRHLLSFGALEIDPNAQNVSTEQLFGQTEGTSKHSLGMNTDSMRVNKIAGNGNQQSAYFEEPKIAQFPVMPERDTWQQLYGCPNMQPFVPEPPAESVMIQGLAMPEVFGDSRGPSLPAQSSFELQVPPDGIRSEETPTSLDPKLESFLAMDLSDPDFPFFDQYPPQGMSMIYGGQLNGLHDNNYPVGQSEMGNGCLSALNNRVTNDPATDSLFMDNSVANNPMAMQYPQNISPMGGIVDHSNGSWQQQQEQIGGTPQEQQGSFSGLATSKPSLFGQRTRNGFLWFGPKPPGAI